MAARETDTCIARRQAAANLVEAIADFKLAYSSLSTIEDAVLGIYGDCEAADELWDDLRVKCAEFVQLAEQYDEQLAAWAALHQEMTSNFWFWKSRLEGAQPDTDQVLAVLTLLGELGSGVVPDEDGFNDLIFAVSAASAPVDKYAPVIRALCDEIGDAKARLSPLLDAATAVAESTLESTEA